MKKYWSWILLILVTFSANSQEIKPAIVPGKLVVKVKGDMATFFAGRKASTVKNSLSISDSKFIRSEPVRKVNSFAKPSPSVLDGIYTLEVDKNEDILRICDSLTQLDHVIYAEPVYLESLFLIPNDPGAQIGANQSYLDIISAYDAWETTTGDGDVIIGIIDTGSDLTHEDLLDKYYASYDSINGVDDDGNGYIDDYLGYDFADDDNDPQADADPHGTRVAGIAGATTNNGLGIAGVGYNCSIRALKAFSSVSSFSFGGYEAIQYAADNGYAVVNLSWGSTNSYSQFNQDIITYAVIEKDLVVVAAAGNSDLDEPYYPASYEYVLSVAATNDSDTKASFSTFNHKVDLSAPGVSIYSSVNGGYANEGGTSYASPMVAGTVALVRSALPELSAIQVMERIKAATDPIYHIMDNQPYLGKLGTGRLNMEKALNAEHLVAMQSELSGLISPFHEIYFGDTIQLYFEITNMFDPVYFAKAVLESSSTYVSIIQSSSNLGYMAPDESEVIGPFEIYIDNDTPPETKLELVLHLTDEDRYNTYHAYDLFTAPDYLTLDNDSAALTIAANGNLGYATDGFLDGSGFSSGNQLANTLGFFCTFNDSIVKDNLPLDWANGRKEQDFVAKTKIKPVLNRDGTTFAYAVFEDIDQTIRIEQTLLQWDSLPGMVFGINYRIINLSADTLWNLTSGLMIDFDLIEKTVNEAWFDHSNTVYTSYGDSIIGGIRTVQPDSSFHLIAVDSLPEIVSDSDKLVWLQNHQDSIGYDTPTNVALLAGNRLDSLLPGKKFEIQFAFGGADSLEILTRQLDMAANRMVNYQENPPAQETYISCLGGQIELLPESGSQFYFYSDPLGQDTLAQAESFTIATVTQDTTFYIAKIDSSFTGPIRSLKVLLIDNVAGFSIPLDTLFLGDLPNDKITLSDESLLPISWFWDFGNGSQASGIQNPSPVYNSPGNYTITLTVKNEQGCEDAVAKELTVLERPAQPGFEAFGYCPGVALTISSTDTLRFYAFSSGSEPVLEGNSLQFDGLTGDSTLYISRIENGLESAKKEVFVLENEVSTDFAYRPVPDSLKGFYAQFELSNPHIVTADWLLDSLLAGSSLNPIFELTNDRIRLDLKIVTDSLCSATFSDSIYLQSLPAPTVADIDFCLRDSVLITPEGGQLFGFYTDSLLTQSIYKGAELWLSEIERDSSIYVTVLDEILPGEVASVRLSPFNYQLTIMASADTIYLDQSRLVEFSAIPVSQSLRWYINGELETTAMEPRLFFNAIGVHQVVAEGIHELGCIDSDTVDIHAFEELIIPLGLGYPMIRVFPIPTSDLLTIASKVEILSVEITDLSGRAFPIDWHDRNTLDLSNVGDGIFLITIHFENGKEAVIKGIKQSNNIR